MPILMDNFRTPLKQDTNLFGKINRKVSFPTTLDLSILDGVRDCSCLCHLKATEVAGSLLKISPSSVRRTEVGI